MSLLVVEHEKAAGAGRLAAHLGESDVRRPYAGDELPVSPAGYAGLVVLGGDVAAWDDASAAWLPHTRRLLSTAARSGLPTFGVCLGAQLLALACGGTVERGAGTEVGLATVRALPAAARDPLLGPVLDRLGDTFEVPHYHRDTISRLPAGAELLLTGDRYPVQAYRVGPLAWGVQYHPEVTGADFADWVAGGRAELLAEGLDPDSLREGVAAAGEHLDRVAEAHATAFVSVVRSAERSRT